MAFLIALVVFVVLMVLGITLNVVDMSLSWVNLQYFIDPPSWLIVFVPAIAFAVAGATWPGLVASVRAAFDPARAGRNAPAAAATLRFFGDVAAILGVVGTLIGLVLLLQNLTDPSALGPSMAVALLTYVYGITTRLLCQAAAIRVERAAGPQR